MRSVRRSNDASESSPDRDTPNASACEILNAWRLIRSAGERFDRIARLEGWPTPFGPVRYLLLAELRDATAYGLSGRRLARALAVPPSSLAYHLDALERSGLIARGPWTVHDRRKVAVRLTDLGRYAVRRLGSRPA